MSKPAFVPVLAILLLSGCGSRIDVPQHFRMVGPAATPRLDPGGPVTLTRQAGATLRDPAGNEIGTARLVEDDAEGVLLTVQANGLTPGLHGLHLHTVGACEGSTTPAFSSAGGHFNPRGRQHGHHNPQGHHSGDLPNLAANETGSGRLSTRLHQLAVADLLDSDGTSLVLHQNEDDLRTDTGPFGPGNSGPRIACGVVERR